MSLKIITKPASEPIDLATAKAHLRVDVTDDDTLITGLIAAARQGAEHLTGRALMQQTWELALDEFEDSISLVKAPYVSISSFKYTDTNGVEQTLTSSDYIVNDYKEPARISPAYGTSWPSTRDQENAVRIRFVAGYADAASVPQEIKQWMLLRIGVMYENREAVNVGNIVTEIPYVDRLLDAYRIWS